ncbi:RNA polymerase II transcription regulator recruiting protein [Trichomonas vaginalis G3]|uniref:RNA polymerase II transcription regulator recruiting protein n=1 Tax=Trichomonas vaginalis (strain ATCC PRA-98 / G3) TaxID=412133 RepID=UPI0021E5E326|nr:RNA polymerase II transcription regulator recruiting protein [Trichomonas vaginalis G3]KAI5526650.1 RNA polymerase II transcription regulator recruiting protein [Trichomonas vaginalis G3]
MGFSHYVVKAILRISITILKKAILRLKGEQIFTKSDLFHFTRLTTGYIKSQTNANREFPAIQSNYYDES